LASKFGELIVNALINLLVYTSKYLPTAPPQSEKVQKKHRKKLNGTPTIGKVKKKNNLEKNSTTPPQLENVQKKTQKKTQLHQCSSQVSFMFIPADKIDPGPQNHRKIDPGKINPNPRNHRTYGPRLTGDEF
jgi:hypothetical protein